MTTGDKLMLLLVCQYLIVAFVFGFQGTWFKMTYWLGAAIITTSVIFMK